MLIYGIIIAGCATAIACLVVALVDSSKHSTFLKKRLSKATADIAKSAPSENTRNFLTEALAKKAEGIITRFVPANISKNIETKILTANMQDFTVTKYFLLKVIIVFFVLVLFPLYFIALGLKVNQPFLIIFSILGFFFPDIMLSSKIKKRHKVVMQELPNYIDLLRVCVEAGLDLDGALNKLVEKSTGMLRDETAHTTSEVRMGKSVAEALQDMSARINLPDFSSFITLIIQANQMGISVSNVLRTQSRQISLKYTQTLRAKAARIPIMILIPMVMFILPALLVVIIGPAIIQVINVF